MISYKSLLLLFLSTVVCNPIKSQANVLNTDCSTPIHFELNLKQGITPDLNTPQPFGYVYSMKNADKNIMADIPIQQHTNLMGWMPNKAAIILTHISMSKPDSELFLKGRISAENANILENMTLDVPFTDIKLGSFAFDKPRQKWYGTLKNNIPEGISGSVSKMDVIHHINGNDSYQELVMVLSPNKETQFLDYAHSSTSSINKLQWNACTKSQASKMINLYADEKERFNEVIDSAVLL